MKMGMEHRAARRMGEEEANRIAIGALTHLASDEALMTRFASVTGIAPGDMRSVAGEPGFLAGVLDFLLGHEPDAIAFATEFGVPPEDVARAYATLVGGSDPSPWLST